VDPLGVHAFLLSSISLETESGLKLADPSRQTVRWNPELRTIDVCRIAVRSEGRKVQLVEYIEEVEP
jgi:hypothetical protein